MKKWKVFLIIALLIAALIGLTGCDAQYRPNDSNWSFGTDGSVYYTPEESNWTIKIW